MFRAFAAALRRSKAQVRDDLRADPYLGYILLLATVLCSFWIWHLLPNFATRDERWRILDVLQPVGFFLEDLQVGSIRDGIVFWRSYGGTFYLYGPLLVPLVGVLVAVGDSSVLVDMGYYYIDALWGDWLAVPGWVWTAAVLPARLLNVVLAVGSVYLVYRIGTTVADRTVGRFAALLTTLTWALLVLAHEAGEDVPALFFFLLAIYLAVEYVDSGSRRTFYWGCLAGGFATGLKFNAGVSALVLGVAHLMYVRQSDQSWRAGLLQPRFLVTGAAIGALTIAVSYPQTVVFAPEQVGGRITRGVSSKGEPHGWLVRPSWWWLLRGYLHGLGLPLALASAGGLLGSLAWVRESSRAGTFTRLALVALGVTLVVYARWAYIRTHHLLLTMPLLVLLVAIGWQRIRQRQETVAIALAVLLVLPTGAYAVVGDLGYAAQGRDQARQFLADDAPANATIETYVRDPQETGVPHDRNISTLRLPEAATGLRERCPEYVVLNYHYSLLFLAPPEYGNRADVLTKEVAGEYVLALLQEEEYPYEVAGAYGPRPRFLDGHPPRSTWKRLFRVGTRPRTIQYGDPQDMGVDQYTVVLERTGRCNP